MVSTPTRRAALRDELIANQLRNHDLCGLAADANEQTEVMQPGESMNVHVPSLRYRHTQRGARLLTAGLAALALPLLAAAPALAQDEGRAAPSLPEATNDDQPAAPDRVQTLEDRINELGERLRESEQAAQQRVSPLSWNGYVDFGFFVPLGNGGAGWVRDVGNMNFPQYSNYSWTFLGDILATAVNSRGEVADLGDAPGVTRFDSVNSNGAAGFILNEINLRPRFQLSDRAIMRASVNFVPRTGSDFALGDFIDADVGELEYLLTADGKTSLFVGKSMPVFGIEYKDRKSDQRFGITPSLIARYTTGSQLGIKLRSKLFNDYLILAGSVTNGSSTVEMFHFYSEIDQNNGKTLNGRAALSLPVGRLFHNDDHLEIGVSGEWGPQDRATDNDGKMWFAGLDVQYLGVDLAVKGQLIKGGAPGNSTGVYGLTLNPSGYLELDWQLLAQFGLILRGEVRDAIVTLDPTRIYITKEARLTVGARVVINPHMVVKAEYLHNAEYGDRMPQIANDVATSSLVMFF
jgi:hypothetical protein